MPRLHDPKILIVTALGLSGIFRMTMIDREKSGQRSTTGRQSPVKSADSAFRSRSTREPGYETDLVALVSNASMVPIPLRLIIGYGFMQHGFAKLSRGARPGGL